MLFEYKKLWNLMLSGFYLLQYQGKDCILGNMWNKTNRLTQFITLFQFFLFHYVTLTVGFTRYLNATHVSDWILFVNGKNKYGFIDMQVLYSLLYCFKYIWLTLKVQTTRQWQSCAFFINYFHQNTFESCSQ
jgi:hypothetical protein